MTTAAPPEKISNAGLSDLLHSMANTCIWGPGTSGVLHEAARRLAPRVGDAVTIEGDDVRALAQVIEEWAAGNYQSDDETALGLMKKLIAAGFATPRALSAPPAASAERGSREPIKADNVNGCAVCGCGSTEFRVGLQAGAESSNHIRVLECVHCQHQMPVPFQQGGGYRKRAAQGVGE